MHTRYAPPLNDIPLETVQVFSSTSFASSCPAVGSGTPLVCVASSDGIMGDSRGRKFTVETGEGIRVDIGVIGVSNLVVW